MIESPRTLQRTRSELPFKPPLNWVAALTYLAARAIPDVETVNGDSYQRTVQAREQGGVLRVGQGSGNALLVDAWLPPGMSSDVIIARIRWLFDLDTNFADVTARLARDKRLARRLAKVPGLRLVRAWDPFELAVRAILGQQVSVAAATTLAGRLVRTYGKPLPGMPASITGTRSLFPSPQVLADADITRLGMPRARAQAISALSATVADDPQFLSPRRSLADTIDHLRTLPGLGEWTANYIALRALGEPDAFPATDLGLRRAWSDDSDKATPACLRRVAEQWRPWRGYAAMYLWLST